MLICVDHAFGVVVIPKVASNTVMNAIRASGKHWGEMCAREFAELPERVALIREPHERAASAYRMYSLTGCGRGHDLSSFQSFVLGVCKRDDNDAHVISQMRLCSPKGEFLPTRLIRWDFEELARTLGVAAVPHDNPSRPLDTEWTTQARDLFDDVFASDIKMWIG